MSMIKKCDRCGVTYELYNVCSSEEKPNGFMFLNIDRNVWRNFGIGLLRGTVENDGNCSYHFGDLSDHRVVCLEQSKGERNDGIF